MRLAAARVLVVDDDPALLMALPESLRLRLPDVEVETADSSAAALEKLDATDFDALISDIKLPGMDGLSLLGEVTRRRPDLPTLLITGHGQHDFAVQALRGGAFDFLQKPLDRDYLMESLSRAIRVRQLRRRVAEQQQSLQQHAADLERAVDERTTELQAAQTARNEFLAMLAHELRNPLASIRCAIDLLSIASLNGLAQAEALQSIDGHVRHMTRQIEVLLDVAQLTHHCIRLQRQPVDLRDIVQGAADGLRMLAESAGLRVETVLPDDCLPVNGDRTRLEQVLSNLLCNAVKFTEAGGRIRVSAWSEDDAVTFQVEDNGAGISPELLPRVFDLFSQADRSLDRTRGGLGIGLTLVRLLVELHDGQVFAHSAGEGLGSTFRVRLPRFQEASSAATIGAGLAAVPLAGPRRIVLVDDNPAIVHMMRKLLQHCGHEVVAVAADGVSAVEAARETAPDVVLLDIGLPMLDGYEAARRIRQIPGLEEVLLVAMTGYGQEQDRRRSRAAGFDRHIVKPVSIQMLQALLGQAATLGRAATARPATGDPTEAAEPDSLDGR